ncbi:hypothetical protein HPB47_006244 [Ixodes persulcatus]|uniref:Uncharacterized protein n=1 Tax=Ixodes persulcatus TaxID=34615 RepID=A0AC60PAV1_IXOPE|nr:hypothetical protein HPB47_006244 [Ixodes persulcatus]
MHTAAAAYRSSYRCRRRTEALFQEKRVLPLSSTSAERALGRRDSFPVFALLKGKEYATNRSGWRECPPGGLVFWPERSENTARGSAR